ncbi:MAG: hypothetical protein WCJ14_12450, partial [Verrucomicrobiota bacterium]
AHFTGGRNRLKAVLHTSPSDLASSVGSPAFRRTLNQSRAFQLTAGVGLAAARSHPPATGKIGGKSPDSCVFMKCLLKMTKLTSKTIVFGFMKSSFSLNE